MKNAFLIHGAYGNPQENWMPWLKAQLEADGYKVVTPTFPTPEGQNLDNWLDVFSPYEKDLNEDSIIVSHSIAVAFSLRVLERISTKIKAAFFVAGFINPLGKDDVDPINITFYRDPFNWERIRANCGRFFVFGSDNDYYVSQDDAQKVAGGLGSELILIKGAGHFNTKAGYTQFPQLLSKINSV
ncbi:MAG TPA: alpha/beta hydrolase [Patescibacteria group bacterium]|nr:alpha/beta hydrolase [Patescibacteria group bacterium]